MSIETLLLLLNVAIVIVNSFLNFKTQSRKARSSEALDWSGVAKGLREELEAMHTEKRSQEAVSSKRSIEWAAERKHLKHEAMVWKIAYAELRHVAAKYVPPSIDLPEPNGHTTPPQDLREQ